MAPPRLTFFCELEPAPLQEVITSSLIQDLKELHACVSLGIMDLSQERAQVVRRLNEAGVPLIAWLLLPREQGYWFNMNNAPQAVQRYADFKDWTAQNELAWDGIGLDIEPDIRELVQFSKGKIRLLPEVLKRLFNRRRLVEASSAYLDLIIQIKADGYAVDSYQFPVIADERKVGSTLLQRAAGLVDLPVDREVWMVYSSFLRPNGAGIIASYAPEAQALGLGTTGAGVDAEFGDFPPLSWEEFSRDLRLAWYWCEDLHIFSLEGCARQGFMQLLKSFAWDSPILLPEESLARVKGWRGALRSVLWTGSHITAILVGVGAMFLTIKGMIRLLRRRA